MRASQAKKAFMLILAISLLCPQILVHSTNAQTSLPTQSEEMYVTWHLLEPGSWGLAVPNVDYSHSWGMFWDVLLQVDNISAQLVPLNLSSPAFEDGFQGAAFDANSYGYRNWWLTFHASYSPMDVGLAENYTNTICSQFQKAFNLNGSANDETYEVDNQTGTITVYLNLGYFPETEEFLNQLYQYRPKDGFAQLITEDTITAYLMNETNGRNQGPIAYGLSRTEGGLFYWSFETVFGGEEGPLRNGDYVNLDVDELLNRTGEITPATEGDSIIWISIQGNETAIGQICEFNVENISPQYDIVEHLTNNLQFTYNVTSPINNIAATISVTIKNEPANPFQDPLIVAIAVTVVIATICIIAVVIKKRRKAEEFDIQEADSNRTLLFDW